MKGIVLSGGSGTRLYPITLAVNKQLLPIYDKPMIYYPLSVQMLAGVRDILIITTPEDLPLYQRLLGDGSRLGVSFSYAVQPRPEGLAQAFLIGRDFIRDDRVLLVLGDNIFFGHSLSDVLRRAIAQPSGATVFAYQVRDPQRYGVVSFDDSGRPRSIEEKPAIPRSSWAVTGMYIYDDRVTNVASALRPSARGELEITDVNNAYLQRGELRVEKLGRGFAWLDTGTCESLLEAAEFVRTIQNRQAMPIACLEEIAFRQGWIDLGMLQQECERWAKTSYGSYLHTIVSDATNGG